MPHVSDQKCQKGVTRPRGDAGGAPLQPRPCSQRGGDSLDRLQPAAGMLEPLAEQPDAGQAQPVAAEVHPGQTPVGHQGGRQVLARGAGHAAPLQAGWEGGRRARSPRWSLGGFCPSSFVSLLPKVKERRSGGARGWGRGKAECLLRARGVSFCCGEHILEFVVTFTQACAYTEEKPPLSFPVCQ